VIEEDRDAEVGGSGQSGRAEERKQGEQEEELLHVAMTSAWDGFRPASGYAVSTRQGRGKMIM
jgi:hypothetical protein